MKRHPRRSDEEWLSIIQECRTSGMCDKAWCEEHHIQPSKFYYHIRRLRAKACVITERENQITQKQEVVPVCITEESFIQEEPADQVSSTGNTQVHSCKEVISVQINGIRIGISNHAAKDTIANLISVVQESRNYVRRHLQCIKDFPDNWSNRYEEEF